MVGDIVIFSKEEKTIIGKYQYGMVDSVERSTDGMIRSVVIRFRNSNEAIDRTTRRSVRHVVVIHEVDELDVHKVLFDAAIAADAKLQN